MTLSQRAKAENLYMDDVWKSRMQFKIQYDCLRKRPRLHKYVKIQCHHGNGS